MNEKIWKYIAQMIGGQLPIRPQGVAIEVLERVKSDFPLCHNVDFEGVFFRDRRQHIGLSAHNIEEVNRRAYAGALSYFMQLSSIDYTLKRYVPKELEAFKESRLMSEARAIIRGIEDSFEERLDALNPRESEPIGLVAADMNLVRFRSTLQAAWSLAERGFLFECKALIRFGLEQIAWIWFAHSRSEKEFTSKMGNECINSAKSVYPTIGKIYGIMSKFAHWHPEEHWRFTGESAAGKPISVIHVTSYYKMYAVCYTLLLADVFLSIFERIYLGRITKNMIVNNTGKFIAERETITYVKRLMDLYESEGDLKKTHTLFAA
jgi:hypothetical protein